MILRRFRRTGAVVALVALYGAQACYAYRPMTTAALPDAGDRVRVVLTPQGTTALARYLGPNISIAEGTVVSVAPDGGLSIAITDVRTMSGVQQPWTGEGAVLFPAEFRSEVRERTFLRTQSIIAGAALTVALVVTAIVALRMGGSGGDGEIPPPPPP